MLIKNKSLNYYVINPCQCYWRGFLLVKYSGTIKTLFYDEQTKS